MKNIDLLAKQTQDAYQWVEKLTASVPMEAWRETPSGIETNICWQVGHLIISYYFHSIVSVFGHQSEYLSQIPVKEYSALFTKGNPRHIPATISAEILRNQLEITSVYSLKFIGTITEDMLEKKLAMGKTPHPVATNVYEALDWNIKHTMWHCGQLGMLKRAINGRWDFGLREDQ
ncbi:DinB family protein [Dyadobacter tibetensis]|uniref:DinB family protein n=1 Tax=Dyadobacter tibetensis TaxID=1211851 RepID=UPI00046F5926|nr:DinB family protein [Dyadobacter tibetensis]